MEEKKKDPNRYLLKDRQKRGDMSFTVIEISGSGVFRRYKSLSRRPYKTQKRYEGLYCRLYK